MRTSTFPSAIYSYVFSESIWWHHKRKKEKYKINWLGVNISNNIWNDSLKPTHSSSKKLNNHNYNLKVGIQCAIKLLLINVTNGRRINGETRKCKEWFFSLSPIKRYHASRYDVDSHKFIKYINMSILTIQLYLKYLIIIIMTKKPRSGFIIIFKDTFIPDKWKIMHPRHPEARGAMSKKHCRTCPFHNQMSTVIYNACSRALFYTFTREFVHWNSWQPRLSIWKRFFFSYNYSFPNPFVSIRLFKFLARLFNGTTSWTVHWFYSWLWPRSCRWGGSARQTPTSPRP